jgi:hypothetical protein
VCSRDPPSEQQAAIGAAETEGIAERHAQRGSWIVQHDARAQIRIARRVLSVPGISACSRHSQTNAASVMPAAPKVCPVQPLVELHGVSGPNTRSTARSSAASFNGVAVPCRLM